MGGDAGKLLFWLVFIVLGVIWLVPRLAALKGVA